MQRDLGTMVDELVEHVHDVGGPGPVRVLLAGHWPDALVEALVLGEAEVRVPAVVGSFEQSYRSCCRRRWCFVRVSRSGCLGQVRPATGVPCPRRTCQ